MSPPAKYRASRPGPPPEEPVRRFRWRRALLWVGAILIYAALMWYLVFPWVDRTWVNQPAV